MNHWTDDSGITRSNTTRDNFLLLKYFHCHFGNPLSNSYQMLLTLVDYAILLIFCMWEENFTKNLVKTTTLLLKHLFLSSAYLKLKISCSKCHLKLKPHIIVLLKWLYLGSLCRLNLALMIQITVLFSIDKNKISLNSCSKRIVCYIFL